MFVLYCEQGIKMYAVVTDVLSTHVEMEEHRFDLFVC